MRYVEVEVGLPIEGPFDYLVPRNLEEKVAKGKRVLIPFRNKKIVGYIINIKNYSRIKKIKPIYEVIDEVPILDDNLLKLTKMLSDYYYCFWGEAIDLVLPCLLRKGRRIDIKIKDTVNNNLSNKPSILLIQDLEGNTLWQIYKEKIKEKLTQNKAVIFLVPEIEMIENVMKKIKEEFNVQIVLFHSRQKDSLNLLSWQKAKSGEAKIAIGTRMAVFLPFPNLGLIIMENENNPSYKEEQSPYYHTRTVALMRAKFEGVDFIISDTSPSLESLYLAKNRKIDYLFLEKKDFPRITLIDTKNQPYSKRRGLNLSYPLQEFLRQALESNKKVMVFLNRKGFSTFIWCPHCKKILKCPRCEINLIYHFKEKVLRCHYCNYKIFPPKICPDCNSSYIRYSGAGTEKVESTLSWLYPQAKILRYEKQKDLSLSEFDFLISTEAIFKREITGIDYVAVLSLDNVLNRIDFRAGEYAFYILLRLLNFNPKEILIQTNIPTHYCFSAFKNKDNDFFYNQELNLRKELKLPPLSHLALIRLRGKNKEKVKLKTELLFKKLKKLNRDKNIEVVSYFAHSPLKLRDNYIWQIMLRSKYPEKLNLFLKKVLKKFNPSNIIINVDID